MTLATPANPHLQVLRRQTLERITRQLADVYDAAAAHLEAEYARALANPRAGATRARLRGLLDQVAETRAHLDGAARTWAQTMFPGSYLAGAEAAGETVGVGFSFTAAHQEAVGILSQDAMKSLLRGNAKMSNYGKGQIRAAARDVLRIKPLVGETATQAGRRLRDELLQRGITSVTYRSGARMPVAAYSQMVARTVTAVAYNVGGVAHSVQSGVRFFEGSDGNGCCLYGHTDGPEVNGVVFSAEVAMGWPTSHPNCVRSWIPRVDVETADEANAAASLVSPEARADQKAFEAAMAVEKRAAAQARASRSAARARGRQPRMARG